MQKFGEKSQDAQTVFIVSYIDHTHNESEVLGVYNSLDRAHDCINQSKIEDVEMKWDVDYTICQRYVE